MAAVRDGMDRGAAAKIGGMDRQTLRDWVIASTLSVRRVCRQLDGGSKPRLSEEHRAQFARIVEAGPDREKDGVVRWRGSPQARHRREVRRRLSPALCRKALKKLGFSHMSARPRHPAQDERIVEGFKNVWPAPSARGFVEIGG